MSGETVVWESTCNIHQENITLQEGNMTKEVDKKESAATMEKTARGSFAPVNTQ
ncbi:hypothetical protein [Desulfosporosinus fructosivorans]